MSEVAALRAQIAEEYSAAQWAMTGFAETGRHAFITAHMERMAILHAALCEIDEEATQFLVETMEGKSEEQRLLAEFYAIPAYVERFAREKRLPQNGKRGEEEGSGTFKSF